MVETVDDVAAPAMTGLLTAYLVMHLDADGRVSATETLKAPDDACVLDLVRARTSCRAVEIWDGVRLVEHFEAGSVGAPSLDLGTNWYR